MSGKQRAQTGAKFLDMQAEIGVSKHVGGREATGELLSLCHAGAAHEVLNMVCSWTGNKARRCERFWPT